VPQSQQKSSRNCNNGWCAVSAGSFTIFNIFAAFLLSVIQFSSLSVAARAVQKKCEKTSRRRTQRALRLLLISLSRASSLLSLSLSLASPQPLRREYQFESARRMRNCYTAATSGIIILRGEWAWPAGREKLTCLAPPLFTQAGRDTRALFSRLCHCARTGFVMFKTCGSPSKVILWNWKAFVT
jgi:hypothetical protein